MRWTRAWVAVLLAAAVALAAGATALAHIERSSYWPLPAADTSVSPPAGGAVPTPRTLASALMPQSTRQCTPRPKAAKKRKPARAICAAGKNKWPRVRSI